MAVTVAKNDTLNNRGIYDQSLRHILIPVGAGSKAGATAGWTVAAGANTNLATCAAGSTDATLVIPIHGLQIGDVIRRASLVGQVESAGNTAVLTLDIRKQTAAAADHSDASLGTDGSGNFTADGVISSANEIGRASCRERV